jgi:hypothetical protein
MMLFAKRRTTLSKRGRTDDSFKAPVDQGVAVPESVATKKTDSLTPSPMLSQAAPSDAETKANILAKQLQEDISDFERLQALRESKAKAESNEGGALKTVKDAISLVLIADFFVIIFFLVWFLAAAALQSTNPFLLERFQDIFNVRQTLLRSSLLSFARSCTTLLLYTVNVHVIVIDFTDHLFYVSFLHVCLFDTHIHHCYVFSACSGALLDSPHGRQHCKWSTRE